MPSTRHCILISQLLSLYISKSSTAFYAGRVTRTYMGWASIYGTTAKEPITSNKISVSPCRNQGWRFLPTREPSSILQFFLIKNYNFLFPCWPSNLPNLQGWGLPSFATTTRGLFRGNKLGAVETKEFCNLNLIWGTSKLRS